jgi:hypothetical protein
MKESISPKKINIHQEIRNLLADGWIKEGDYQEYELEPKAYSILHQVETFFKVHKKKTSSQILGKEFVESMTKYNELFPRKKAGSNKYMRSNIKNVETNFRWFFANYQYSWETILEATSRYIKDQEADNYKYTRTSMYFIHKKDKGVESSDLADWCEMVVGGEDNSDNQAFKEKVV